MKKKLLIVKKFGGTSLSNEEKIKKAAGLIKKEITLGNKVVVVVSALGKTTDKLQLLINKISLNGNAEEIDTILSSGEQASSGLMALALKNDFTVIITSDHGNIENDTPSHTSNDVLTTIISKKKLVCPNRKNYIVNLFDIFPTILKIMNIEPKTNQESNFSYNGSYLVK